MTTICEPQEKSRQRKMWTEHRKGRARERERAETPFTKFILLVILAAGTGMQMFGSDTRECAVRCDGCFDVNIATTVTHNSCQISVTYQTLF